MLSTKLNTTFAEDNSLGILALHRLSLRVSDHEPATSVFILPSAEQGCADPRAVWGIRLLCGTS